MPMTEEEWKKHFGALSTETLIEILAAGERFNEQEPVDDKLEHKKLIKSILVDRGLSGSHISDAIYHLPIKEEERLQEDVLVRLRREKEDEEIPYLVISICIFVGLVVLPFLGWLAWTLINQHDQGDPAIRDSLVYGVIFGIVLLVWAVKLTYKIDATTRLHGFPLPLAASEINIEGSDDWWVFSFPAPVYLAFLVIDACFFILIAVCFLLYASLILSMSSMALLFISLFILIFAIPGLFFRKHGQESFLNTLKPSPALLWIITSLIVLFALFMFVFFNSEEWDTPGIIFQIVISAIAIAMIAASITSRR